MDGGVPSCADPNQRVLFYFRGAFFTCRRLGEGEQRSRAPRAVRACRARERATAMIAPRQTHRRCAPTAPSRDTRWVRARPAALVEPLLRSANYFSTSVPREPPVTSAGSSVRCTSSRLTSRRRSHAPFEDPGSPQARSSRACKVLNYDMVQVVCSLFVPLPQMRVQGRQADDDGCALKSIFQKSK